MSCFLVLVQKFHCKTCKRVIKNRFFIFNSVRSLHWLSGVPHPFSSLPRHISSRERCAYLKEGDSGKPLILKRIDPTGIRTCNLLICSQAPNPLGHRAISFFISIFYWLHLFVDSWRHFLTSVRPVPGPPLRLDGQLSIKNGSRFCYHLSIIVAMEMSHVF